MISSDAPNRTETTAVARTADSESEPALDISAMYTLPGNDAASAEPSQPALKVAERALLEGIGGEQFILQTDIHDETYQYRFGIWQRLTPGQLSALAFKANGRRGVRSALDEIVSAWKRMTIRDPLILNEISACEIPIGSEIVDLRDMSVRAIRHTDFLTYSLPWTHERLACCPTWTGVLETWFGDAEHELVRSLQEFFGYVVMPRALYKKALFLTGPSNAGKSVVLHVLRNLVGEQASCSVSPKNLLNVRYIALLEHARVNVVPELSAAAKLDDDAFKALVSSEEPVLADRKYGQTSTIRPRAKHVFASNYLINLSDPTPAMINRLLIVPMERQVAADQQDPGLVARLIEEMPGIINWSLEGAERLYKAKGQFSVTTAGASVADEMRSITNPVEDFVQEACVLSFNAKEPVGELHRWFCLWSKTSIPRKTFSRMIVQIEGLKNNSAIIENKAIRCIYGLRLRTDWKERLGRHYMDMQC